MCSIDHIAVGGEEDVWCHVRISKPRCQTWPPLVTHIVLHITAAAAHLGVVENDVMPLPALLEAMVDLGWIK